MMKITASTGRDRGKTMRQKIWTGPAPSTLADSSRLSGMVSMKPLIRKTLKPMAPPMYTMIKNR
jgi:hypothetical protein